jgi:hypothetical protein
MSVVAFAFAWRYPLGPNSQGLTDIGKLSRYRPAEFVGYVLGMLALFGCYLLALRLSRRLAARQALPAVFGCATLMALGMDWMYPVSAIDSFLYAVRSRILTTYGANPSAIAFNNFPSDSWNNFITPDWAARVSPYGPLWNQIAAPVTWLAGDRILIALLGFKILSVLALLAGGWAIARALQAAGRTDAASGALFYLWNPLVLWEGVGNGHNDVLLTLPLLLALLAWITRRDLLVIPLLVVAALIKYVTLPLIPLATIALWQRPTNRSSRWRILTFSVLLSVAALLLGLYPFYDLAAIRASVTQQGAIAYTSPAAFAVALLHQRYPSDAIARWAMLLGTGVFVAALAWQASQVWRRPERLPRACFETMYVFLLAAVASSRAWYLIWPVGLAALLPWGWPAWRIIGWTAGALASYGLLIWIEAWWQPGYDTIQIVVLPIIIGATLLLTLAELVWRRRPRPAPSLTPFPLERG